MSTKTPMTETTNHTITRNEVALALNTLVFTKKAAKAGTAYEGPQILSDGSNLADVIKWASTDWVVRTLNNALRLTAADIYTNNLNDEGLLDEAQWEKDMTEFSTGFVTLNELEKEQAELVDDMLDCTTKMSLPDITDEQNAALLVESQKINAQIRSIRKQHAVISAQYKERADKRAATKAKKEAEVKAAAAKAKADAEARTSEAGAGANQ